MSPLIKKAIRQRVFLKIAAMGPSGSGKTLGSIALAKGLAPTGKILVVDTENRSASYYATKYDFDVIEMEAPFTSQKYMEALQAAVDAGYEVVVFDSMSHEWAATGGVLDKKAQLDRMKGEKWGNWQDAKTPHSLFREAWLQAPLHVIATMRSKMEYVLEANEKGKQIPRKVGLAPIQEGDAEYEYGIAFEIDRDTHLATASKDRTGLFDGRNFHLSEAIGKELTSWLASSEAAPVVATPEAPRPAPKQRKNTAKPETAAEAFQAQKDLVDVAKPPVSQAAHDFVESIDPSPEVGSDAHVDAQLAMFALCNQHSVSIDALAAYLASKGKMTSLKAWESLDLKTCQQLVDILSDATRRHSFITTALKTAA